MLTQENDTDKALVDLYFQQNDINAHIVEVIPSALVVIDRCGIVRIWNRAAAQLTMLAPDIVIGQALLDIYPDQREATQAVWQQFLQDGRMDRAELELSLPSGERLAIGFSMSVLKHSDGSKAGAVIIARGLNEQKRYETLMDALDLSSRKAALSRTAQGVFGAMASALRGLHVWSIVLMLTESGDRLSVEHINLAHALVDNPELQQLTDEEFLASTAGFTIPVEEAAAFRELMTIGHAYFRSNTFPPQIVRFPPLINQALLYLGGARGLRDAVIAPLRQDGQIVGDVMFGGYVQPDDVAPLGAYANQLSSALTNANLWTSLEERVAQRTATLQAEQERQQAILNNMTDAVVFTSRTGMIEYVNPSWERLHGQQPAAVIGRPLPSVVALKKYARLAQTVADAIAQGRAWHGELINVRGDGTEYYGEITLVPVHDDAGEPRNFVGVERDITYEKELMRAKDRFVSDMSHELRTPLANIKFYLSLLERGKEERRSKYMETLKRESNRLHNLIEDLLTLSRLDQDRAEFKLEPIGLNDFLDTLTTDRAALIAERGLTLHLDAQPSLPPVTADRAHLEQIAANLLANAILYTQPGGELAVSTVQRDDERASVGFCVRDTGLGIDPDEIGRIFERFYRGRASRETNAPGTGLGLSLCQEIVTRLGGTIEIDSTPGVGSTVTVWLTPWRTTGPAPAK